LEADMAGRDITVLALYVVAFAIATRMFIRGSHESAYLLIIGVFLLLLAWVWRGNRWS
jgi:hypothetical protein